MDRLPLVPRLHDGGTAGGLCGVHPRQVVDQVEIAELRGALVHPDEADAAAGRVDDRVGHVPVELFDRLVQHRLLRLVAVGRDERLRRVPVLLVHALAVGGAGVGDLPLDDVEFAAVDLDHRLLGEARALGQPDVGVHVRLCGVGCGGLPGVAGGVERDRFRAVLGGGGHRAGLPAVLERPSGVVPLVFDVHLADAHRLGERGTVDQRRRPLADRDRGLAGERQQRVVAPQRVEALPFERLAGHVDRVVVVRRVEDAATVRAAMRRGVGVEPLPAVDAVEAGERVGGLHDRRCEPHG